VSPCQTSPAKLRYGSPPTLIRTGWNIAADGVLDGVVVAVLCTEGTPDGTSDGVLEGTSDAALDG
jgi:hypothetical protein